MAEYASLGALPNAAAGAFSLSRSGPVTDEELSDDNLLKVLQFPMASANVTTDLEVSTLVWKCLGYRFDPATAAWSSEGTFPNFRAKYPDPPDFVGWQRTYSKEVDGPVLKANQALCKTIPVYAKQSLKESLGKYGFRGFKLAVLTPNLTRRAQCANWLLYYRDELHGKPLEQLKEEREMRIMIENEKNERLIKEGGGKGWSPPVTPLA